MAVSKCRGELTDQPDQVLFLHVDKDTLVMPGIQFEQTKYSTQFESRIGAS